jgi:hypothetical protein
MRVLPLLFVVPGFVLVACESDTQIAPRSSGTERLSSPTDAISSRPTESQLDAQEVRVTRDGQPVC